MEITPGCATDFSGEKGTLGLDLTVWPFVKHSPFFLFGAADRPPIHPPPQKKKKLKKALIFCDTLEALCWFLFLILQFQKMTPRSQSDTKWIIFFSTAFLPAKLSQTLPIPSSLPHPLPTTNLLPPQSPRPPTDTPFFPAPHLMLLLPQLLAQGSCPGSLILAEILTSLSNPGQSWHLHTGSPWEKAGRSAWGCGLRAQPTWALPCCNHFKCDFLLLLFLIILLYKEELPLSEHLTTGQAQC